MTGRQVQADDGRTPIVVRALEPLTALILVLLPVAVAVRVSQHWPHPGDDFYPTVAQIIATLFVAIAVELFARDGSFGTSRVDRFLLLTLLAMAWFGLFGCVRGMLGADGPAPVGVAAGGLMAAAVLAGRALFQRIKSPLPGLSLVAVAIFLVPPMILLVYF